MTRRYGLYWNRSGELYNVTSHDQLSIGAGDDMCRIENLSNGTHSYQTCGDALDRQIEVGWFVPCLAEDLARGAKAFDHNARWQRYYGGETGA